MRALSLALATLLLLPACGVRTPPVPPPDKADPAAEYKIDCSPQDPDCDRIDPNYQRETAPAAKPVPTRRPRR